MGFWLVFLKFWKEVLHMASGEKMDRALAALRAETEGVSRQVHADRETRPQPQKERQADYQSRRVEHEGRSSWSGGSMGGGTWGGRSRSQGEQP
jgi:hypothetical protein